MTCGESVSSSRHLEKKDDDIQVCELSLAGEKGQTLKDDSRGFINAGLSQVHEGSMRGKQDERCDQVKSTTRGRRGSDRIFKDHQSPTQALLFFLHHHQLPTNPDDQSQISNNQNPTQPPKQQQSCASPSPRLPSSLWPSLPPTLSQRPSLRLSSTWTFCRGMSPVAGRRAHFDRSANMSQSRTNLRSHLCHQEGLQQPLRLRHVRSYWRKQEAPMQLLSEAVGGNGGAVGRVSTVLP